MKRFKTPEITVKEFSRASILAASETGNIAAAKNYLNTEKDISTVNIVSAVIK